MILISFLSSTANTKLSEHWPKKLSKVCLVLMKLVSSPTSKLAGMSLRIALGRGSVECDCLLAREVEDITFKFVALLLEDAGVGSCKVDPHPKAKANPSLLSASIMRTTSKLMRVSLLYLFYNSDAPMLKC